MLKFTILSENKTENSACFAEHGLSIYIETEEMNILFDTGASTLFAENGKRLKVDLRNAEAAVISHGHFDHTNGVMEFHRIAKEAPIYIHKNAFYEFRGMENGVMDDYNCGILWTKEEKAALEESLKLTDGPLWLTDNIVISGTIPDVANNPPTEKFFIVEDGKVREDDMSHEQFLAVGTKDGVYIFSGCSHKGVIPVLEYAKKLFKGKRIAGLIAGMHLYSATAEDRRFVVNKVVSEELDMVMPVHCTGIEAICMLKEKMGDKCIVATTGDTYQFE